MTNASSSGGEVVYTSHVDYVSVHCVLGMYLASPFDAMLPLTALSISMLSDKTLVLEYNDTDLSQPQIDTDDFFVRFKELQVPSFAKKLAKKDWGKVGRSLTPSSSP